MLWLVIEINILISILCFYLAWRIWKFRQILLQVEQTLNLIENCTDNLLKKSPNFFQLRKQKANRLRKLYGQLKLQIKQVQELMAMFWLLSRIWHRLRRVWR
ncbi:MAG: hypothetical protein WBA93_14380 [Microcoleaceae cyanobacterium]